MYNFGVSLLSALSVTLLSYLGAGETSAPNSPVFQLPEFQHFEKNEGQFDTSARVRLQSSGAEGISVSTVITVKRA